MKNRLQNRFFKNRFTRVDVAALLLFAAVWVYYIVTVRYGFCTPDESYSLNVAQRLAHGDRLLIDKWCPGQFFSIFLLLPYRAFLAINGSADGIILF